MTTVTFSLNPIPKWYFADQSGKPLGGGFMQARSSLSPNLKKDVFTDASGTQAWPVQNVLVGQILYTDVILFDANGEQGPFFWRFDTANPTDLYDLFLFDANGNPQWTILNYGGNGGSGGGGGTITVVQSEENYIHNNIFWRNQGSLPVITSGTVIAPSNHEGLTAYATSFPLLIPNVGPDIMFVKNNAVATDQVDFLTTDFGPGQVPLTGDVTPPGYLQVTGGASGGEAIKAIQFPVDLNVKNLEQQTMTAIIWAKPVSGNANLTMNFVQYFGAGSVTTPVVTPIPISASPLSPGWNAYVASFQVPSIAGKNVGPGADDATYLQVNFPTNVAFVTSITKPKLYLGSTIIAVFPELTPYDDIEAIINSPRTGDTRTSLNSFAPFGWVQMNDGTIGRDTSASTTRSNADTWPLYNLLWSFPAALAPSFIAGVPTARGLTAIGDFSSNIQIGLTKALGRVFSGAGSLPTSVQSSQTYTVAGSTITVATTANLPTGTPVMVSSTGNNPGPLFPNTTYYVINLSGTTLQLASSLANAVALTNIVFTSTGTGVLTIASASYTVGSTVGEDMHLLTVAEMPSHTHTPSGGGNFMVDQGIGGQRGAGNPGNEVATTSSTGGSNSHNNLQPTTYMNVFIKL